jgi:hypothetical protein
MERKFIEALTASFKQEDPEKSVQAKKKIIFYNNYRCLNRPYAQRKLSKFEAQESSTVIHKLKEMLKKAQVDHCKNAAVFPLKREQARQELPRINKTK